MDVASTIRRHPGWTAGAVVALVVLAVAGFLWFRPDRLFTEDRVNEAVPGAAVGETGAGGGSPTRSRDPRC